MFAFRLFATFFLLVRKRQFERSRVLSIAGIM